MLNRILSVASAAAVGAIVSLAGVEPVFAGDYMGNGLCPNDAQMAWTNATETTSICHQWRNDYSDELEAAYLIRAFPASDSMQLIFVNYDHFGRINSLSVSYYRGDEQVAMAVGFIDEDGNYAGHRVRGVSDDIGRQMFLSHEDDFTAIQVSLDL